MPAIDEDRGHSLVFGDSRIWFMEINRGMIEYMRSNTCRGKNRHRMEEHRGAVAPRSMKFMKKPTTLTAATALLLAQSFIIPPLAKGQNIPADINAAIRK